MLGASNNPAKWGYALARSALKGAGRRAVFFVNRSGGEILGQRSYRSLDELPERPELVAIVVRAPGFESAVDDALRAGAKAIVAITSGLGERDQAGQALQQSIADRVRAAGAVLVGPNCLGIADTGSELDLTWDHFQPGPVGLVSQSGNLGLELAQLAQDAGVGFSRFVSVGNQADIDAAECLESLIDHAPTRVIATYVEDFRDGRAFASIAENATRAGKPVVLLTVGSSAASVRTAHSHTGGLVSDSVAVDAACRASGMFRVETPRQTIDLLQILLMPHQPSGRRVAVIGDGGGHVALAADRLANHGSLVEPFSDALTTELARRLPSSAATRNPVDIAGAGEEDVQNFERVVRRVAESGEADVILLTGYFGGYSEQSDDYRRIETDVADAMARVTQDAGRPLVVHSIYPKSPTSMELRRRAVPVYGDIEAAAIALGHVASHLANPALGIPITLTALARKDSLPLAAGSNIPPPRGEGREGADYFEVRHLLATAGIPFAEACPVTSEADAVAAASEIGYPVVLKALGSMHKSDACGVRLRIANEGALRESFREVQARSRAPLFSVEREAPIERGVELLIGVKRDRSFGPIALVGLGGVQAEVLRDVAVALAPVSVDQGVQLIRSLRGSELLIGWRGRPRLDIEAAARALSALSHFAATAPLVAEVEINPLLVLADQVIGLDARLANLDS